MKKIVSTTLAAIALSVAMVSTVDARFVGKAAMPAKKSMTRDMNAATKDLVDPQTPKDAKKDAAAELLAILNENSNELELAQLYIQRKQKMNEIMAKKDEIAAMKVGWFDFGNVEYKKAKDELGILSTELKEISSKISAQEKVVGRETSNAVRYAVGGLVVAMGIVAVDYATGSNVRTFIESQAGKAWAATEPARQKVRALGARVSAKAGEFGTAAGETYRKYAPARLGGTPTVVEQGDDLTVQPN